MTLRPPAIARKERLQRLEHHRDALATADAGGADAVTGAAPAQLVHEVHRDARAARRERMAERDGAAVDVGAVARKLELLQDGEHLSFTSNRSTSESFAPARARAFRIAGTGPIPMIVGSTPACPQFTMRAS